MIIVSQPDPALLDINVSDGLPLVMTYQLALTALADPTRRRVFEELRRGPRAVGKIAARMPVSRPAVSQHLAVLKQAGLVLDRAEGTRRVYYIDPHGLAKIRTWLDQFWDEALLSFKAALEGESES
jgi:DNA-binding transcriptional ArsR family regulator